MSRSRIKKIKSMMLVIGRVALMIAVIDMIAFVIILLGENADDILQVLSNAAWYILEKEMLFVIFGAAVITALHIGLMKALEPSILWWLFIFYEIVVALCGAIIVFAIRICMISFGDVLELLTEYLKWTHVPYELILVSADIAMVLTVYFVVRFAKKKRSR